MDWLTLKEKTLGQKQMRYPENFFILLETQTLSGSISPTAGAPKQAEAKSGRTQNQLPFSESKPSWRSLASSADTTHIPLTPPAAFPPSRMCSHRKKKTPTCEWSRCWEERNPSRLWCRKPGTDGTHPNNHLLRENHSQGSDSHPSWNEVGPSH